MAQGEDQDLKALTERLMGNPDAAAALNRVIGQSVAKRTAHNERARRPERLDLLRERQRQYEEPETFAPGDLVVWKPGMKNRNVPDYDVPVVVVEVLDPPVIDEAKSSGSPYYREPLSLRLGMIDEDDDFLTYHFDGRRFTHYMPL